MKHIKMHASRRLATKHAEAFSAHNTDLKDIANPSRRRRDGWDTQDASVTRLLPSHGSIECISSITPKAWWIRFLSRMEKIYFYVWNSFFTAKKSQPLRMHVIRHGYRERNRHSYLEFPICNSNIWQILYFCTKTLIVNQMWQIKIVTEPVVIVSASWSGRCVFVIWKEPCTVYL